MNDSMKVYDPTAPCAVEPQAMRHALDTIRGKTVGFIDNANPNFNHLVDDLGELLVREYGVAKVVKHRKTGQVPVEKRALDELAEQCDAVITGSGD